MTDTSRMIDANTLAADCANRCGWPNKAGFKVAHADDIAKAMLAFLREVEAAKLAALPTDRVEALRQALAAFNDFCMRETGVVNPGGEYIELQLKAALAADDRWRSVYDALPPEQEVSEDEMIEVLCTEGLNDNKFAPTLSAHRAIAAIRFAGYRIVKGEA